jgi:ubiquinone biosynthesis protein
MLIETIHVIRDLPRLHEIASVLIRYGWGDAVRVMGIGSMLERAGRVLHWQHSVAESRLDFPVRARRALEELGPTFIKLGQLLATRVDMLPPALIAELEKLQASVPAVAFDELRPQLVQALGREPEEIFGDIEHVAFAAASMAQVHRATLPDGARVVLKIRRPNIEAKIEADLRILDHLARLLESELADARRYQPTRVVAQFRRSLRNELDLAREARNIDYFARNFRDDPMVKVPRVYWEWTSAVMNVQEEVIGLHGADPERLAQAGLDPRLIASRGADVVLAMILQHGFFHADPHPGNVIFLPDNRLALIDFGMVGRLTEARRMQLVRLLAALAHKDEPGMANILLDWSGDAEVDEAQFSYDLSELVYAYDDLRLKDVKFGALLSDITALMREHRLSLPADLTLLFKALISLEGLGMQLDPGFHMVDHMTPFVERIVAERMRPSALWARGRHGLKEALDLFAGLPRDFGRLLRQARRGRMRIELDLKRLDHFGQQIDHSVTRLTMGVLTASLVVGSSIVLTLERGPMLFGLPLLGVLGFAVAFVNSVWILWSMWRAGKV